MPDLFSRTLFLFALLLLPFSGWSQSFRFETNVPLLGGQLQLGMPWTGGLNAVQASQADTDGDGQPELVLFDRSSSQVQVFAKTLEGWQWLPQEQFRFPQGLTNWLLLADYNGDGRKDIFTFTSGGVQVFEQEGAAGKAASWQLRYPMLFYAGTNAPVNLLVNSGDVPLIQDTDGDGDVDIAAFDPAGRGTIRWYQNVGQERFGRTDTLVFELSDRQWGGISECGCQELVLNYEACPPQGERLLQPLHAGGKSLLWKDLNGDGVPDLVIGDEECTLLYYLPNTGTAAPRFERVDVGLPGADTDPNFPFPAAYALDELLPEESVLVSTNLRREGEQLDLRQSLWLYQQQASGQYQLQQKDFLQDQMLDVGEEARPAFLDLDADGDQDLLLGSAGNPLQQGYYSALRVYENTGTAQAPAFRLQETDYLETGSLKLSYLQPQQADYNADGAPDLIISGYDRSQNKVRTFVYLNQAAPGTPARFGSAPSLELPLTLNTLDYPYFFDENGDKLLDVLVGRFDGSLRLFANTGTAASPAFALQHEAYKGFGLNNFRRPLVPTVGNINGNPHPDLVLTDGSGDVRVLYDFLLPDKDGADALPAVVAVGEGAEYLRMGDRSWPVAAPLWQGQADALVIGQIGGGLVLLSNQLEVDVSGEESYELSVYPSPTLGRPLRMRTNAPAQLVVYSGIGQQVASWQVQAQQELLWEPQLPPGMYIVVARFGQARLSKKIIVRP